MNRLRFRFSRHKVTPDDISRAESMQEIFVKLSLNTEKYVEFLTIHYGSME